MEVVNKYHHGKIYKITDNAYTKCYIGSTVEKYLSIRMGKHRSCYRQFKKNNAHLCCSYNIFDEFGLENCKIELIEAYKCETKEELLKREGYYVKNTNCVNKLMPGRTKSEYWDDNKEEINIKRRATRQTNGEAIREKDREYRLNHNLNCICECGSSVKYMNKAKHNKSMKHQEYVKNQNP